MLTEILVDRDSDFIKKKSLVGRPNFKYAFVWSGPFSRALSHMVYMQLVESGVSNRPQMG